MSSIEDRLRDAYRGAAQTVSPDTIRQLDEVTILAPARHSVRPAYRRLMIPLAAASAVALVVVLTAVVIPGVLGTHSPGDRHRQPASAAGSPAGRYLVTMAGRGENLGPQNSLVIRNVASGATVTTIASPRRGFFFDDVATGDGRTYVADLVQPHGCGSWLYRFRLDDAGQPGPMTPFALPHVGQIVQSMAISRDNSTFAYTASRCPFLLSRPSITEVALDALRTRQWTLPPRTRVAALSLTANGRLLAYDLVAADSQSSAYVLPTSAEPGPAVARSRTIATSAQLGQSTTILSDVITLDGSTVYLATRPAGGIVRGGWQLRAADVATGTIHLVGRYRGFLHSLAAGPGVQRALVVVDRPSRHRTPNATPSPSRYPSPSPSRYPPSRNATPSPSPSRHRTPNATPSPSPSRYPTSVASPSPSRYPTSLPSPSPSRYPTSLPSPSPSRYPTPAPSPAGTRLVLIDLGTGSSRVLSTAGWNPGTVFIAW